MPHFYTLIVGFLVSTSAMAQATKEPLQVDCDFPGGNIVVDDLKGDTIYLHQDLRDTVGDWFYWYFRIRGGAGRTLKIHFTKGTPAPVGVRGPAVSDDRGESWRWLGAESMHPAGFTYAVPLHATEVRFCFAFPYQAKQLQTFLARHAQNPHLQVETLCVSNKGRPVELLRLGRLDREAAYCVALTCRHHCCEMMASYVLEGIIDEVLADREEGKWLREHVEFFIVPMVDKDGVEDGDQGKNRKPRDHNRDYEGKSVHPSVAAIRQRLPEWSQGKLQFALDMHCPAARGPSNEIVYFVGGPDEKIWSEVFKFSRLLETNQRGPIFYRSKNNMPYGQGWNTEKNFTAGKPFSHFASELPGIRLATTIEVAYANAEGDEVTDASARALGNDLARALRKYLAQ